MSTELRPLGVSCNLACHYCYQNPEREAGNEGRSYDVDKMKAAALKLGNPFALFGGEPLLMRFADVEHLFEWGLEVFGGSSIQTNGVLIETRHIDLFRRCKVSVGVSVDGPGELNDARWHRNLEKTRQSTSIVHTNIRRLCQEYQPPGLIVTLHRGNATAEKLPIMCDWFRELEEMGIRSVRLHLLEVDHSTVGERYALSVQENFDALLTFAELEGTLKSVRFDLFREMEHLLMGEDQIASCTWRACDPYTTEAVQGVEGNGQTSNCGRTNKDGIGFIKAERSGYERYLALFNTPQSENGCQDCRLFLMCKGQCPGTAIAGDWRNRTEHCEVWKRLFGVLERRLIVNGKVPISLHPIRFELERRQIELWSRGENPPLNWILSQALKEGSRDKDSPLGSTEVNSMARPSMDDASSSRISWVGEQAREVWQPRFRRVQRMIEDMVVHSVDPESPKTAVRLVPETSLRGLTGIARGRGLSTAVLPARALPNGIPAPTRGLLVAFLTGNSQAVAASTAAFEAGDMSRFFESFDGAACCRTPVEAANLAAETKDDSVCQAVWKMTIGESRHEIGLEQTVHPLFSPLGLYPLPLLPCGLSCAAAMERCEQWFKTAIAFGYSTEVGWFREALSWSNEWTELNGVTEIKTPILKLTIRTSAGTARRELAHSGSTLAEGAVAGLRFPFAAPTKVTTASQLRNLV